MMWFLSTIGTTIVKWFTGGGLEDILDVIDSKMDNETKREEIKAEVTKTYINAKTHLMVGRTWWFQLFFVVPLGIWWTSIIADSIMVYFSWWGHTTTALPAPLDSWAGWIISALFGIDMAKAAIGRFRGK